MTKAFSQAQVDQMRADLRALDAQVVYWDEAVRKLEIALSVTKQSRHNTKRKQRALAAKVARIEAAKEQGQ